MGKNTAIAWTDHTWNPWRGCHKVSAGCKNCYMFTEQTRYGHDPNQVVRAAAATFNAPLHWHEPARVFTCSWSDWNIPEADPWRAEAWDIIRQTPHLTYQILTKRASDLKCCLPDDWGEGWPNVWLGVTIENEASRWRAECLCDIPARVRFVSYEPALGPLELATYSRFIQWVICGGESGPNARPMHPDWARAMRDQCHDAGISFFFKQWGEWAPVDYFTGDNGINLGSPLMQILHGGQRMQRLGKKAAGDILDHQTWHQFPEGS